VKLVHLVGFIIKKPLLAFQFSILISVPHFTQTALIQSLEGHLAKAHTKHLLLI